ncbi:uncharacterized protein TNCV_6661 [Trichonephila clavipes]|nr:uncharacterized protein TNCV_6661 [Trichonephila clavipes]
MENVFQRCHLAVVQNYELHNELSLRCVPRATERMWLRNEGRLFGVVFVLFNVLLAIFNVLNYRVASRATVPCVVIVAPTPPPPVDTPAPTTIRHPAPLAARLDASTAKLSWTDSTDTTGDYINNSTTPHTRVVKLRNSTQEETIPPLNYSLPWETEQRDKYTVVRRYIPADGEILNT